MRKFSILIILLAVFVLTASGCDKLDFFTKQAKVTEFEPQVAEEVQGTILARVGSDVITLEDFNTKIDNYNQMSQEIKIDTFDKKKAFLQTLIQRKLLYQHAISLGLDKDVGINQAIKEFRRGLIVQKLVGDELTAVGVEAEEIENFYKQAKDYYRIPMEIKVLEIAVSSEDTARQVLIELLKGANFASLAQQYSKTTSARNGGKLGWIKPGDRKLERFDKFVFSLEKGEFSNVFKTPQGYFIVKAEDKRGGEVKPISEVWDQVKGELLNFKQNQRIVELERNLRTQSTIELHEELLR